MCVHDVCMCVQECVLCIRDDNYYPTWQILQILRESYGLYVSPYYNKATEKKTTNKYTTSL